MALLTLDELKALCGIEDSTESEDLLLEKYLNASCSQLISGIGADPRCEDDDGNPIKKLHKVKKFTYDPCTCTYCFDMPIPVKEVLTVNGCMYKHSACGREVQIKAPACIENCFGELEVEYYGGWDDISDLCILIKNMVQAQQGPTKNGSTIKSAKFGCETLSFCCPDTNFMDIFYQGVCSKYFINDVTCVG